MAKLFSRSSLYGLCLLLAFPVALCAQQEQTQTSASQSDALSPEARYVILFRRLAGPPAQSQQSELRVARPNYSAVFQRSAQLSDEEARALNQIAEACMQKVAEFDKRSREIIAARRAEERSRNAAPGDQSTAPPPELSQLQKERNNVILSAIEQIRLAFGDAEFKRFDEYVKNQGNGKRFVLPPANKKALPIQVTITILDRDGSTSRKQFAANEKIVVQVAMLNNSTQMIAVKESEVYGWLQIISAQNGEVPLGLLLRGREKEPAVDLPPAQLTIVGRIELGPDGVQLKPGAYQIVLEEKVLLNRPPDNSEFLQLSLPRSERSMFEIVP